MSMNTYPIISKPVFFFDREVEAYVCRMFGKQYGDLPKEIEDMSEEEFAEKARNDTLPKEFMETYEPCSVNEAIDDVIYASGFEGSVEPAFPDKSDLNLTQSFDDDFIVYLEPQKEASLFSQAYESPEALVEEFKERLALLNLPDDFDWFGHLLSIYGTYFS